MRLCVCERECYVWCVLNRKSKDQVGYVADRMRSETSSFFNFFDRFNRLNLHLDLSMTTTTHTNALNHTLIHTHTAEKLLKTEKKKKICSSSLLVNRSYLYVIFIQHSTFNQYQQRKKGKEDSRAVFRDSIDCVELHIALEFVCAHSDSFCCFASSASSSSECDHFTTSSETRFPIQYVLPSLLWCDWFSLKWVNALTMIWPPCAWQTWLAYNPYHDTILGFRLLSISFFCIFFRSTPNSSIVFLADELHFISEQFSRLSSRRFSLLHDCEWRWRYVDIRMEMITLQLLLHRIRKRNATTCSCRVISLQSSHTHHTPHSLIRRRWNTMKTHNAPIRVVIVLVRWCNIVAVVD